jgi:hypothetical protein
MAALSIVTGPVEAAQLYEELGHVAHYFKAVGHDACKTVLGFAWGNEYYAGDWLKEVTPLQDLTSKIQGVERSGLGRIGSDDLLVCVAGLEFLFCHEGDIHLDFDTPNEATEHFLLRWRDRGYLPTLSSSDVGQSGGTH